LASHSTMTRFVLALALVLAADVLSHAERAHAQMGAQVEGTPKGTIGLGLIGAELGLIIPVSAGLDETWSLLVFHVVGGAAGALGGYFGFDRQSGNTFRGLSIGSLVLGMGMIIPTIVITVGKTRYNEDDLNDDREDAAEDAAEEQAALLREEIAAGPGLLRFTGGRLRLSMPGVEVLPLATAGQVAAFGQPSSGTEIRFTLLSGAF
jgi:hypothetical protein